MAGGAVVDFEEGRGRDPFLTFPEEVWVMILDKVEDSRDAWNLLKAFPQLDVNVALQKKKRFWLFGLVIPHLIPWRKSSWIKENDLISCRRVCKQWSTAVDGFLEGQPQLRAYHPETQVLLPGPGRFHWNVKAYLYEVFQFPNKIYFGGARFVMTNYNNDPQASGGRPLQRFLRDMEVHPQGRNPFLSRALSISNWDDINHPRLEDTTFAEGVSALHRKFGEHVWFYTVAFTWRSMGASCLIQNIGHLPNLKMLHVAVLDHLTPGDQKADKFVGQLGNALPALPFLETLRLRNCPHQISHFLIGRFAPQIRRLDLYMNLWRDEYSKLFPNLTAFDISDLRGRGDGDRLKRLLSSLEAPQLAKLQIKFAWVHADFAFVIEDDVFQWLRRFPNMKFLDLGYGCRDVHSTESGTLDPANDSISSLQFLAIQTSFEMNYNFLRCLPSLQHLQLYVPKEPFVIDLSTNPVVKILEEIQTGSMYKSNIWELLPKLRTVALLVKEKNYATNFITARYTFNREGYEFERRLSGQAVARGDDDDTPEPLRRDIINFLEDMCDYESDVSEMYSSGEDEFGEDNLELANEDLSNEDSSDDEGGDGNDEEDFELEGGR